MKLIIKALLLTLRDSIACIAFIYAAAWALNEILLSQRLTFIFLGTCALALIGLLTYARLGSLKRHNSRRKAPRF